MTRPPETIQVGPYTYRVLAEHLDDETLGHTHYAGQTIRLEPSLAPDAMAETLLHECLHAIWDQGPFPATDLKGVDEQVIRAMAPPLLDLLRRNTALVRFLLCPEGGTS